MTILAPATCTECAGFNIDRPATCVADYWPSALGKRNSGTEFLCDTCAANSHTYCNIRPLASAPEVAPTKAPEAPAEAPSAFAPWFQALLDQNLACADRKAFEAAAYYGHIAYNRSMTDGYYAPEDLEAWVIGFRKDPINALYWGNEARHTLAPMANDYLAGLAG